MSDYDFQVLKCDRLLCTVDNDWNIKYVVGTTPKEMENLPSPSQTRSEYIQKRFLDMIHKGVKGAAYYDSGLMKELFDHRAEDFVRMFNGISAGDTIWIRFSDSTVETYQDAVIGFPENGNRPLHLSETKYYDISNGLGIRLSLFFSGCEKHCSGCFNRSIWSPNSGPVFSTLKKLKVFQELLKSAYDGISILGGEPMEYYNYQEVGSFLSDVRKIFGNRRNICVYSGYTWEELEDRREALKDVDVLVDGPFVESLKSIDLSFRGSSNQRIIHVPATLEKGEIVIKKSWES